MMSADASRLPSAPTFAIEGRLADLTRAEEGRLLERGRRGDARVSASVAGLIEDVRRRGARAVREQALRFDGVDPGELQVPPELCEEALDALPGDLRAALTLAARNIEAFHRAQLRPSLEVEIAPGLRLGRRSEPLRSVGAYAPGGRAAYPSTVLMCVIPAKVAGVERVVVCSPPGADGTPHPLVLAACALAGADHVAAAGGAAAIAAMAMGVAGIPAVDKIVGPGNVYVVEAKRQVAGSVAIDSPAGPSEVMVIADGDADPALIAAELLAQAEHDPEAAALLVVLDPSLLARVRSAVGDQLALLPRRGIIEASLAASGALLVAADLDEALAFAEQYAPEHLLLLVPEHRTVLTRVRSAGTILLGPGSSVTFGDYTSGANHTLPTGSLARAYSGLSTAEFQREVTFQEIERGAAARLAEPTAVIAEAEGFHAHAAAARLRAGRPEGARGGSEANGGVDLDRLATPRRAAYASLDLYQPDRKAVPVDLSDNTNLFGPAPSAARILRKAPAAVLGRYPTVYGTALKVAVARALDIDAANVVTGCGSDDLIDSILRAFCEPGDLLAYPDPTFGMVPTFGRMNALRTRAVPLGPAFALEPSALLECAPRAIYACSPNNPTGNVFESAALRALDAAVGGIVVLDEAYIHFGGEPMASWAVGSARCIVLRTFSKAYGLAGVRVGFGVGPAELIREVEKSRGPYKVGGAAEAAAIAAIEKDGDWLRDVVRKTRENRDRLSAALRERGLRPLPSDANFILLPVPAPAPALASELRSRGVQARPFAGLPGAGECLRVTAGPWRQMERFLSSLDAALELPSLSP